MITPDTATLNREIDPFPAASFLADIRGTRWQRATGGGKGKNNFSSLFEGG